MLGRHWTRSAAETERVGAELARALRPGDIALISGDLGAGKTTLVRGACRELGITVPVTSPTFTIGQRYGGRPRVAHLDLYRVGRLESEDPDLLADYVGPDTITFVEWPPQEEALLADLGRIAVRVRIEHAGGDAREIDVNPGDVDPGAERRAGRSEAGT